MSKPTFTGHKVLEERSYLFHNCLKFYLDKDLRYPVRLSLNDMLFNVQYEIGDLKVINLMTSLAFLQNKEKFHWVIYAQYVNTLGDVITKIECIPSDDMKGFIKCKVSKQKLKSGDSFKILFTFTRNEAFFQFLENPKANVAFGLSGKARRTGVS